MKGQKKLILCISIIIVGLIIIVPNYNYFVLKRFSSQLFDAKLPDDISRIDQVDRRGKLNGNGNGMDFFSCILVKTDRSKDELEDFMKEMKVKPAKDHKSADVDIEVVQMENSQLDTKYVEREQIQFDSIENESSYDDYYALILYDGGYSAGFDLTGH